MVTYNGYNYIMPAGGTTKVTSNAAAQTACKVRPAVLALPAVRRAELLPTPDQSPSRRVQRLLPPCLPLTQQLIAVLAQAIGGDAFWFDTTDEFKAVTDALSAIKNTIGLDNVSRGSCTFAFYPTDRCCLGDRVLLQSNRAAARHARHAHSPGAQPMTCSSSAPEGGQSSPSQPLRCCMLAQPTHACSLSGPAHSLADLDRPAVWQR